MTAGDPWVTVTEETFVARFLLDRDVDTEDSVANVDVFVDLPEGVSWALTMFTVDEVRRLLAVWKGTGEVAHGSYFWCADDVIVPEPGLAAMTAAIRELVRSREIEVAGVRCEPDPQDDDPSSPSPPSQSGIPAPRG
ncbi:hypothetical protein [Kineosporia sp. A_224]|uniref:hypothetical protein n=1 Tax=Kineosporia sp. A_224 TaxID=1962180 RepID=UPI0018E99ECA|nr:hypothetical protein [Kineosporia sp. A_224]